MSKKPDQFALWFSVSYGLISGAWILGSDRLAGALFTDAQTIALWQTCQGLGFAGVTAVLIYWVLNRAQTRWRYEAEKHRPADISVRPGEEKLRAIREAEQDCVKLIEPDGTLREINIAGLKILEVDSAEAVVGKPLISLVPPEYRAAVRTLLQEVARGEKRCVEFPLTGLKGTVRWMELSASPFHDATTGKNLVLGISKDISARKQVEAELSFNRDLFQTLLDNSPDHIYFKDLQSRIIKTNQAHARKFNLKSAEDMVGKTDFHLFAEAHASEALADEQEIIRTGRPMIGKVEKETWKDGRPANWVLTTKMPFRNKTGETIGTIGISKDITREKNAEQALQVSEAQLRATFDSAAIGMALVNLDGRLMKCNPMLAQMLGYSPAELCSMTFAEFTHPDDLAADLQLFRALLAGERNHYELEKRYLHKDGQIIWGHLTVSLVRQADNAPSLAIGMVEDITERRNLEEQVRQSQKMEAIGLLASGVAHDFNNVLAIIQLQAGVLGLNEDLSPTQQESALEIIRAAERAANLTRQLLMFSRKQNMQLVNLNLNQITGQMTKMLQRVLSEDISLAANYAPHLPLINADAGMMEQILMNLAVNSRDAMPKGGKLTITTGTARLNPGQAGQNSQLAPGLYVRLTVTDTGAGIAAENLAHIFEPFFTTKEIGKGTGLGLATVYGIVEQHRGWVNVTSELNRGTTFNIYFPAVAGDATEPGGEPVPAKLPQGTETIFVVEDATAVRTVVCHTLRRCGYNILQAESGREALAVWPQYKDRVDLLLTDIVMPNGLTGFELARQLQETKPGLKVIYTSGYSGDREGNRGKLVEGFNFLQKPYAPQKLAEAVRKNLDQK